jgi:hypothetical protein
MTTAIKIFTVVTLSLFLQCCRLYDATKYADSDKCEIHNQKMHKTLVKVHYGNFCPARVKKEYKNAKSIECMGCVVRSPRKYLAIKYYCKKCNKFRRADKAYWIQRDKDS